VLHRIGEAPSIAGLDPKLEHGSGSETGPSRKSLAERLAPHLT